MVIIAAFGLLLPAVHAARGKPPAARRAPTTCVNWPGGLELRGLAEDDAQRRRRDQVFDRQLDGSRHLVRRQLRHQGGIAAVGDGPNPPLHGTVQPVPAVRHQLRLSRQPRTAEPSCLPADDPRLPLPLRPLAQAGRAVQLRQARLLRHGLHRHRRRGVPDLRRNAQPALRHAEQGNEA